MKILSAWCVVLALTCGAALGQTYKVLWSFGSSPSDGASSVSNLIFDKAGNLYGTTQFGGSATNLQCGNGGGCGTVFELSPNADGTWTNNIIYNFCANYSGSCLDGQQPTAGLAMDAAGNLYGTTYFGGPGCGNASA
ncbi:MAG: choice-of-anchor tandem repeat GloVer-containing protein, partial [Terriglobales bacterium]